MSGRSSNSNEDTGRAKKKGGGFLARQSKAKKTITEEELLKKDTVTPDDVLKLTKCTESKLKVVYILQPRQSSRKLPNCSEGC